MCKLCKSATPLADSISFFTAAALTSCGVPAWEDRGRPTMKPTVLAKNQVPDLFPGFLTFHQYPENILRDGDSRPDNEHREQEGADGIRHFIFRLWTTRVTTAADPHEQIREVGQKQRKVANHSGGTLPCFLSSVLCS